MTNQPRRVEKPWGHEIIWAHTDRYVGKILHVDAGHLLSVQYHERKDETIYVLQGDMVFRSGSSADDLVERRMRAGESVHIPTGTVHQMEALADTDLLEVSTPELDDVVRLKDRYGRA